MISFSTYFYRVFIIIHRIIIKAHLESLFFCTKKAYVLGYVDFEFVVLKKAWNMSIVKLCL